MKPDLKLGNDLEKFRKTFIEHFDEIIREIRKARNFDLFFTECKINMEKYNNENFEIQTQVGFCKTLIYFQDIPSETEFINTVRNIFNKIER